MTVPLDLASVRERFASNVLAMRQGREFDLHAILDDLRLSMIEIERLRSGVRSVRRSVDDEWRDSTNYGSVFLASLSVSLREMIEPQLDQRTGLPRRPGVATEGAALMASTGSKEAVA